MILKDNLLELKPSIPTLRKWLDEAERDGKHYISLSINESLSDSENEDLLEAVHDRGIELQSIQLIAV